jgi:DNA repair exonuclease SbcCD ATPase subunit
MKQSSLKNLLEEDHASLGDLIAQLCAALDERDVEQSFARLDLVWARLAVHIRAEHLCLFPILLDAARQLSTREDSAPQFDEAQSAINQLRHDHDFFMVELARVVNIMREIENSRESSMIEERFRDVQQTIISLKARLEEHNKLEEEQVYRWPAALLNSTRQARLAERVQREIENMPPRFAYLSQASKMENKDVKG